MKRRALQVSWTVTGIAIACALLPAWVRLDVPADAARGQGPDLERGALLYARQCAVCHGDRGIGDGPAAFLLSPAPRDFSSMRYRLTSTVNGVPALEDILSTLTRGMPGSAMPPFDWMPREDLLDVAAYARALAIDGKVRALLAQAAEDEEEMSEAEARAIAEEMMTPGPGIDPGERPELDAGALQEARRAYLKTCALCHGADGTGRNVKDQRNEDGTPTAPRDFTAGVFKGGSTARDIVLRLRSGMAGSPMPASTFEDPADAWAIAAVVESMIEPGAQERVTQSRKTIRAVRARGELPSDAASPAWEEAESQWIAVAPLWWRDDRIEGFVVRVLHDGDRIAVRMTWEDPTRDEEILGQTTFCDAAGVQLSAEADPPLFTMGSKDEPVNVWQWKAAWELDLARVRDVADYRVNTPPDAYGTVAAEDAPLFLTGRAAGNPQSVAQRDTAGDVLAARGFGTLAPLRAPREGFEARGAWVDGFWDVVFTRSMEPRAPDEVPLLPGSRVFLAGALFDGAHGDRNGQKSITVWHVLEIER